MQPPSFVNGNTYLILPIHPKADLKVAGGSFQDTLLVSQNQSGNSSSLGSCNAQYAMITMLGASIENDLSRYESRINSNQPRPSVEERMNLFISVRLYVTSVNNFLKNCSQYLTQDQIKDIEKSRDKIKARGEAVGPQENFLKIKKFVENLVKTLGIIGAIKQILWEIDDLTTNSTPRFF